jgi:hypothetical protein
MSRCLFSCILLLKTRPAGLPSQEQQHFYFWVSNTIQRTNARLPPKRRPWAMQDRRGRRTGQRWHQILAGTRRRTGSMPPSLHIPQPCPEIAPCGYHPRIEHPSESSPRKNCLLAPRSARRVFESGKDGVHNKTNREKMRGEMKANLERVVAMRQTNRERTRSSKNMI